MSARLSTKDSVSIAYGKVEVRAKLPRGDWLWPAIWMMGNLGRAGYGASLDGMVCPSYTTDVFAVLTGRVVFSGHIHTTLVMLAL